MAILAGGLVLAGSWLAAGDQPPRHMKRSVLEDKIRGGWVGQIVGVTYGGPTEFRALGTIFEGAIAWDPARVEDAIDQDDLYVEMTFAQVMDTIGLDATSEQYGEMFKGSEYHLWHANAAARRALNQGIEAPWSGHPMHNLHANDIDFQIEADFIGLMAPGLPRAANQVADRVGRVMNYGDGLYGGMFVSGMYAAAFFEDDPRRVVEQGVLSIPARSGYARIIRDVLRWSAEYPGDWKKTWRLIEEKWDKDDRCPDGALAPFNIDARLNGAYIALGLLYGEKDLAKTVEIATRAGQDSDCNPSSAAGVLGVMLGYAAMPEGWTSGIPAIADRKFAYTRYSLNEIVASTMKRAERLILAAGGEVSADEVVVPLQSPQAPPLEQWDPGPPIQRLDFTDLAWTWRGGWTVDTVRNPWSEWQVKAAGGAGDEAGFTFDGTGVAIVGRYLQDGGRADVYLDGAPAGRIDAWIPERTNDNDLWHMTGLAPGRHTVRLVVRADKDDRSTGRKLHLERAIIYGTGSGPDF
jgi:hypothetical protein